MICALAERSEPSPGPSLQGRGDKQRPSIVIAFTANEGDSAGSRERRALCQLWDPERQAGAEITGGNISPAELFQTAGCGDCRRADSLRSRGRGRGVVRWRCPIAR